jgi:hypothetical protein
VASPWTAKIRARLKKLSARKRMRVSRMDRADVMRTTQVPAARSEAKETM